MLSDCVPSISPIKAGNDTAELVSAGGLGPIKIKVVGGLREQREEIAKAFLAKYGLEPNEVEQIVEQIPDGFRWFIRKKTT